MLQKILGATWKLSRNEIMYMYNQARTYVFMKAHKLNIIMQRKHIKTAFIQAYVAQLADY